MQSEFFNYNETRLHFSKSGRGPQALLAFHGFGQNHQAFDALTRNDRYTLFSFDIFFHGKSEWNKLGEPLEKIFWKGLLLEFLKQHQIDRFSLIGYSMGGKFALATLEAFPEKIDRVFLIAPDGVKTNAWYSLATYPLAMRSLFKSMILKPKRFQFLTSLASKLDLIDKGIVRFAETQMNTEDKRNQVYYSWVVFRHLKFDVPKIARLINTNKIDLRVIIGKYDKIVTAKNMEKLLKRVKNYKLEILETGHTGLLSKLDSL